MPQGTYATANHYNYLYVVANYIYHFGFDYDNTPKIYNYQSAIQQLTISNDSSKLAVMDGSTSWGLK